MPHTRSAKKNARKTEKRRLHNRSVKRAIKKQIRVLEEAVEAGNVEQVQKEYNLAAKKLDKAAVKRVVHPNQAARKKSQLARLMNQTRAEAAAPANAE